MKLYQLLLFIAVFVSLYGGMHLYVYRRLVILLPGWHWLLALLLCLLLLLPLLVEVLIHNGVIRIAAPMAWIGFSWMGVVFLLFSALLALDLYRGLASILHRFLPQLDGPWLLTAARGTLLALLLALVVALYGFFAARRVNLVQLELSSAKLNGSPRSIRIIQISDLHLGHFTDLSRLSRLVSRINALKPDLIVSTGDLIDMALDPEDVIADQLMGLQAPLGTYAVTGNHEAYAGLSQVNSFVRGIGFRMLSGAGEQIGEFLSIAGVDDPAVTRQRATAVLPEQQLLQGLPPTRFTLLLKHQPVVDPTSRPLFDLQLSGHTHGGQIFPFNLLTRLFYRLPVGLTRLESESWVYVSRGTGTWGPPIRVLAPAELTVIDLLPQQ
ncbi:MAG: metallophosphoesterase [Candidatus Delongbacteria bacterium]|nr:metallophosphoesterase [Candidatus Delongbacteria bacterium]